MAPSAGGHLLVSKSLRLIRYGCTASSNVLSILTRNRLGIDKAARIVRDKIPQATQSVESQTQPVYARIVSKPVNRVAAIRQSQSRWFTTKAQFEHTVKRFYSTANNASKPLRSSYPPSRTGRAVSQLTSRTPFASTLRPNLTGGTLSRSSGGYNTGAGRVNGARYFSHTPASPAEVVQNVSQAIRAFWLSGQKAHFNGLNPKTGEKRFRAVSTSQDKAFQKMELSKPDAPGSFIDFKVSPTITAIGPLSMVPRTSSISSTCEIDNSEEATITNANMLTTLEVDFARALKDLAAIMNDLKHLSVLGSLPLSLVDNTTLRVRFPGCDADTVEALCRELNIRRGMVGQDPEFDEYVGADMALLFPFAPSRAPSDVQDHMHYRPAKRSRRDHVEWEHMLSPAQAISPPFSHKSAKLSHDLLGDAEVIENPWLSSPSGYSSLHASSEDASDIAAMFFQPPSAGRQYQSEAIHSSCGDDVLAYEGLEGIYKFIGECERAQG